MDTSSTRDLSAATWATIVVSELIPSFSPPIAAFPPLRSSDPMISRFTGEPARESPGADAVGGGARPLVADQAREVDRVDVGLQAQVDRRRTPGAEGEDADHSEADRPGPRPAVLARVLRHAPDASPQVRAGIRGPGGGSVRVCG